MTTISKKTTAKKTKEAAPVTTERKFYKMTDDLIAMIRELVQLSLLTGSNIVDHLRSVVVEPDESGNKVTVCPEYIVSYNSMLQKLQEEAELKMRESLREQEAQEEMALAPKRTVN